MALASHSQKRLEELDAIGRERQQVLVGREIRRLAGRKRGRPTGDRSAVQQHNRLVPCRRELKGRTGTEYPTPPIDDLRLAWEPYTAPPMSASRCALKWCSRYRAYPKTLAHSLAACGCPRNASRLHALLQTRLDHQQWLQIWTSGGAAANWVKNCTAASGKPGLTQRLRYTAKLAPQAAKFTDKAATTSASLP